MVIFNDKPIVSSLLAVDWYKFTMGNYVHAKHPDTKVRYAFTNRHAKKVWLPEFIEESELREEIEHARSLSFHQAELAFLRESRHIPKGLLSESYLASLRDLRLPEVDVAWKKDGYKIETEGTWHQAMHWETILMNIVNVLYFREVMRRSGLKPHQVWAEGTRRLMKFIELVNAHRLSFVDFGLRRCFDLDWCDTLDGILVEECGGRLAGISNVELAMKHGKPPKGTCAHEMLMVTAGLASTVSDAALRAAPMDLTRDWAATYGKAWSVAIPDTFGSESFIADLRPETAGAIDLYKIDSGDPFERGDRWTEAFLRLGIHPLSKKLVFSDGLDGGLMDRLAAHFHGRIGLAPFGIGTNLTNNVGFTPLSIVVKASHVLVGTEWVPLVKLSDNLEKASGPKDAVDRYTAVFDYRNDLRQECMV